MAEKTRAKRSMKSNIAPNRGKKSQGQPLIRGPNIQANEELQKETLETIRRMTERILAVHSKRTLKETADYMGLEEHNISMLVTGYSVTSKLVIRMVKNGRFTPRSIMYGDRYRKLPKGKTTRAVREASIHKRIVQVLRQAKILSLARATGLSSGCFYRIRNNVNSSVSLKTIIALVSQGASLNYIFFGKGAMFTSEVDTAIFRGRS